MKILTENKITSVKARDLQFYLDRSNHTAEMALNDVPTVQWVAGYPTNGSWSVIEEVPPNKAEGFEGRYQIGFDYQIEGVSSFNSLYIGNFQTDTLNWRVFYKYPSRDQDQYFIGSYISVPTHAYRTINRFVRGRFQLYRDYFKSLEDVKNDYARQKQQVFFFEVDQQKRFINGWDVKNDPLEFIQQTEVQDWIIPPRLDGKRIGIVELTQAVDGFGNDVSYYYGFEELPDRSVRLRFSRPCTGRCFYAATAETDAMHLGYIATDEYGIELKFGVNLNLFDQESYQGYIGDHAELIFTADSDVSEVQLEGKTYFQVKGSLTDNNGKHFTTQETFFTDGLDVGSFILFDREDPIYVSGNPVKTLAQIIRIEGDGSDPDGITILFDQDPTFLGFTWRVSHFLRSVRLGLLRAGYAQKYPNPQVGLSRTYKDFSVRNELINGGYQYINRNVARVYGGSMTLTRDLAATFLDFSERIRAKPFAVEMLTGMEEEYPAVLFCAFESMPDEKMNYRMGQVRDISFQFKEIF